MVENQGKLFDFVAQMYPDKDTKEFINTYMASKTRKSIDEAQAYVNTMDAKELWNYLIRQKTIIERWQCDGRIHAILDW